LHGNVAKQAFPTSTADVGSKVDVIAVRTHVGFKDTGRLEGRERT
jgi:hypothetical protein